MWCVPQVPYVGLVPSGTFEWQAYWEPLGYLGREDATEEYFGALVHLVPSAH